MFGACSLTTEMTVHNVEMVHRKSPMCQGSHLNRALFKGEYGCEVGSDEYYKLFEVKR